MKMTEDLLSSLVLAINGSYKITFHPEGKENPEKSYEIDFTPPFRRVPMMEALSEKLGGVKMPENYETEEAREFFDKLAVQHNVAVSAPRTISRLIDKLVGHFIEVDCKNPTFLMEHP